MNLTLALADPAVQSALISAIGTMGAAAIAAISAAVIGKRFDDRMRLKEKLDLAINDIAFLLAVEEGHCRLHSETTGRHHKLSVRDQARDRGFTWSARFTPGRVEYRRRAQSPSGRTTFWNTLMALPVFASLRRD